MNQSAIVRYTRDSTIIIQLLVQLDNVKQNVENYGLPVLAERNNERLVA